MAIVTTTLALLGDLPETEKKHAPPELFLSGDPALLTTGCRVSIIGTRKPGAAGIARTKRLVQKLVEAGAVIVSGLAAGIDTVAHQTAIEAGGKTIAVIGTPLTQSFPKSNKALQEYIATNHLLISQFSDQSPVAKGNFPRRNRTMALFSDITVIVEAGEKSGSLSQGWETIRLGRRLLIMKALFEDTSLSWPAKFANYGAEILSDDSLSAFLDSVRILATK